VLIADNEYSSSLLVLNSEAIFQINLITTGYIKTLRVCCGNPKILQNNTFIHTYDIINREVNSLTEYFTSKIDYLRAMEKGCLNCGDNHKPDCPVGMAKAKINCTNDLLTEFYKRK
jgi:hypothetical protein